jgi:hypothetical protein
MHSLESELASKRGQLVQEDPDAPLDAFRPLGAAAADLVVDDEGPPFLGQALEWREVMVGRAGPRRAGRGAGRALPYSGR